MKKIELVYKEILFQVMEKKNRTLTQDYLARTLQVSLSTVNYALKQLLKMNSIRIKRMNFEVVDARKILYYWASIRDLEKDIIYKTRSNVTAREIEKNMPSDVIFTAYSAYKFMFKEVPSDYSEVYIYTNNIEEIKKRFKETKGPFNLFVLKKNFGKMTLAHLFVDFWNLKEWYSKDFLKALEEKINGILA